MQIKKCTIIYAILYAMTFLNIRYFAQYYIFRDICIVAVAIYLFLYMRQIYKKCNKGIVAVMLVFFGILMYSFYRNYEIAYTHRNDLLIFSISLLEVFLCLSVNSDKEKLLQLISVFYKLQLFFVLLNDLLILVAPGLASKYNEYYLLGNKFTIGYQHILLIGLFLTRNVMMGKPIRINEKMKTVMFSLLLAGIAVITNSATSLVIVPLFILFIILRLRNHDFIYSRAGYMMLLALSTLFVVAYDIVLSIEPVQLVITQVLGRSATLTSRTKIYALIPELLNGRLLWGYGYGTSYDMLISKYYFPNTQNGILEWIWQGGIFTAITLVILIGCLVKYIKANSSQTTDYRFMYDVACVFAVISSVEIVIDLQFLTLLIIVYYLSLIQTSEPLKTAYESIGEDTCRNQLQRMQH